MHGGLREAFKKERIVSTYALFLGLTLVALVLIKIFGISYPLSITTTTRSGELAVVGEGKVEVVPDTASIEVGIAVGNALTVEETQKRINAINNAIVTVLKDLGIDKSQIRTSNYSVFPNYGYDVQTGSQQGITGYNGNVSLSIKVKDVNLVSQVIEMSTKAGANQVFGTSFSVEDPGRYREEARTKAIQNAREQAEKIARTLGIRLGRVVNIVESSPPQIPPLFGERVAFDTGFGGGIPPKPDMEPGTQTITSTVTLYFEKR